MRWIATVDHRKTGLTGPRTSVHSDATGLGWDDVTEWAKWAAVGIIASGGSVVKVTIAPVPEWIVTPDVSDARGCDASMARPEELGGTNP